MALFAGFLSAAELKLACFNHFTSYFKDFRRPENEIVSIRKMPQAEIIRQLAAGQLSMAITDRLPEDLRNFDVTELAVAGTIFPDGSQEWFLQRQVTSHRSSANLPATGP